MKQYEINKFYDTLIAENYQKLCQYRKIAEHGLEPVKDIYKKQLAMYKLIYQLKQHKNVILEILDRRL